MEKTWDKAALKASQSLIKEEDIYVILETEKETDMAEASALALKQEEVNNTKPLTKKAPKKRPALKERSKDEIELEKKKDDIKDLKAELKALKKTLDGVIEDASLQNSENEQLHKSLSESRSQNLLLADDCQLFRKVVKKLTER